MRSQRVRSCLWLAVLGLLLAPALLAFYAWRIEPRWIQVRHVTLPIASLPPELDGFTILQLSDLHRGPQVSAAYLQRVVEKAARLKADMVVLTGDFVTGDAHFATEVATLLGRLSAPYGVYAVTGNHDVWTDADAVTAALAAQGIRVLRDEALVTEARTVQLALIGLEDTGWVTDQPCPEPSSTWRKSLQTLADVSAALPKDMPRLALIHNPDLAHWVPAGTVDAVLSGHTHGGQVRLPLLGTPVVPSCHGARYAAGLTTSPSGIPVYVNRGIGTAILPLRFGVRPEITLIHLTEVSHP